MILLEKGYELDEPILFSSDYYSWKITELINRKDLFASPNRYLPNNTLTLFVQVVFYFVSETIRDVSRSTSSLKRSYDDLEENEIVYKDYNKLYENMAHSDLILECGGKELKAHKIILSGELYIVFKLINEKYLVNKSYLLLKFEAAYLKRCLRSE